MNDLHFQFISSFIAMAIPLLFVAAMLGRGDGRRIILYFCWGLFTGVLVFNLNNYLGRTPEQAQRLTVAIAPMIEEVCKVLPLLLLLRKKSSAGTRLVVFCAMASGAGFSIQESMYYFAASQRELGDLLTLVFRTLTTALMHSMTAAAFGIGLMYLKKYRQMLIPSVFGLLALCASIHALFNLLLQTNLAFIAVIMPVAMLLACRAYIRNDELVK